MKKFVSAILLLSLSTVIVAPMAAADEVEIPSESDCNNQKLNQIYKLQLCVNASNVFEHLHAFQAIADAKDGTRASVPPGSEALEDLFEAYYSIESVPYDDSGFTGRSDYQPFVDVGIPSGGLFTGAEGIKTGQQAAIWGGTSGEQYNPCYHLACDTVDNLSIQAIEVNVDAIAYAIYNLAATTEAVNGVEGVKAKGITPDEVVLDGPQGTFLP
jgi:Zn-dependent M28 family amino/carboxypeptidase